MLVYGDRPRREAPADKVAAIRATLAEGDRASALIEAGELAQGLADVAFDRTGHDDDTPNEQAAMRLCVAIARGGDARDELAGLGALPSEISVRTPEGYAYYGLHPNRYAHAAVAHHWGGAPLVIGLRSIGSSLAAVVAATTEAREVITVRPTGHPFRRELRLSPRLAQRLASHRGPFALVDEGPGLSGSSFGAAADALEALGVSPERIVFLPGHAGDLGPEASPAHRERWARAIRLVDRTPLPVAELFSDITGPVAGEPVPGTTWKVRLGADHVARFVGLGRFGEPKLARARALYSAGFGAEPLALREGMLLQRWIEGQVWAPAIEHLGRYLRFRRDAFPEQRGADDGALIEMVRVNVGELLGEAARRAAVRRLEALPLAAAKPRPVHVDARLHAQEWVGGRKLDAIDHSEAHDLIGPQDIAWDVAGAAVEFDLSPGQTGRLAEAAGADPIMLDLFALAYPAFQAGLWRFAGDEGRVARYRDRLAALVGEAESAD